MTQDELLIEINRRLEVALYNGDAQSIHALRAVVELHKLAKIRMINYCEACTDDILVAYPCPTIQAIEKELQ